MKYIIKNVDIEGAENLEYREIYKRVLATLKRRYSTIEHDDLVQTAEIMSVCDGDVELIKDGTKTISIDVVH